ncbi:MAG: hypothetical protein AAB372_01260 [Patescibacteria group bacterium]
MDTLLDCKQEYLRVLGDIWKFFKEQGLASRANALWLDKVLEHTKEGGAGDDGSERALTLRTALREEIKNKIFILDTFVPVFEATILQKNDSGDFLLEDKLISIRHNTAYYHLLEVLFTFANAEGFLSYDDLKEKLQERKEKGLFGKGKKATKDYKKTIENACEALFRYAKIEGEPLKNETPSKRKLIDTRHGEGLVLNNEIA